MMMVSMNGSWVTNIWSSMTAPGTLSGSVPHQVVHRHRFEAAEGRAFDIPVRSVEPSRQMPCEPTKSVWLDARDN
jgi:hypothetical protein